MALGGGTWAFQNKVLAGTFINFISAARASAILSDRGIATIPLVLDWGELGKIVEVTTGDLQRNSMRLFGYSFTDPKMKPLRELFRNIRIGYIFRLGTGGVKATNTYATARHAGVRGNALKISVQPNPDDITKKIVMLMLDNSVVNTQTVGTSSELADDDYVIYNKTATLDDTSGMPLAGGINPTITNGDYQTYLDAAEPYSFNSIGCPSNDSAIKLLFTAFTKRMRDERGVKFQCVTYNNPADFEGNVNAMNKVTDDGADEFALVYWVTGAMAGTAVNRSALNKIYDGEYTIDVNYTQTQLETAITSGKFGFHKVGNDIRVLADINSLVTVTVDKGEIFKENQTIRVIDQIANDIAVMFNTRYLGIVPNDEAGRISLWADIVKHHEQLKAIRAIENFTSENVTVEQGETKRAVLVKDSITVVNAMAQLYMSVYVS